jgi:hypothetical protein
LTQKVINHLSRDRFATYLSAAGFDQDRALQLYAWNMRIAASFYPLLSSIEVCLRNQMEPRLSEVFGSAWWTNHEFIDLLGKKGKGIVLRAAADIEKRGKPPTSGRMTAELSFGFWTNMLLPKYEAPLWPDLRTHFPDIPDNLTRPIIQNRCEEVRDLRNRISHHEPIFMRDLSADYGRSFELLRWLGPAKADWIKPQLETMKILRQRP